MDEPATKGKEKNAHFRCWDWIERPSDPVAVAPVKRMDLSLGLD
jgi:hypothetical protein